MKKTHSRRQPRGFVLIVVLALLLLLTIVASLAYSRASDQLVVSSALRRQAIAQDRALMGMQRGVSDVKQSPRPGYLLNLELNCPPPVCANSDVLSCPVCATMPVVDNGVTLDLEKGGGSQYLLQFHRWQPPGSDGSLIVVHATGYHGYDPVARPGATRMSSEVIVEVSEGQPNSGGCVGYCGGGL